MTRILKLKELKNTKLANNYGGWIYCQNCNETIGYLCYVTYDMFKLNYECKCGSHGNINISFIDNDLANIGSNDLIDIKNRLCCADDNSPLFTLINKKLASYSYEIICKECNVKYKEEKKL